MAVRLSISSRTCPLAPHPSPPSEGGGSERGGLEVSIQKTTHQMLLTGCLQLWLLLVADARHKSCAARIEWTSRRPVIGMWHGASDRGQPFSGFGSNARNRAQQRLRVRMLRGIEDLLH